MKKLLSVLFTLFLLPAFALAQTNPKAVVGGGYTNYTFGALVGAVQTVKGTRATFGGYHVFSPAGTVCYLQIFNVASATTVTLGATAPTLSIGFSAGGGANIPPTLPGADFPLGIKIAATTTRAGAVACGTGMDVNIWYK